MQRKRQEAALRKTPSAYGLCGAGLLFLRRHAGDASDEAGRRPGHDAVRRHVPCDHGPGGHDGIVPDGDAGQHDGAGAYPDVPADDDGGRAAARAFFRRKTVVDGGQHDPVPDQAAVAESDAALVLEAAAGVDEDVFPDGDVFPEVAVKGREEGKRAVNRLSRQSRHEVAYLFRRMVGPVQFRRDTHGVVAALQQQIMLRRAGRDAFPLIEMLDELFRIHDVLLRALCCSRAGRRGALRSPAWHALTAGGS